MTDVLYSSTSGVVGLPRATSQLQSNRRKDVIFAMRSRALRSIKIKTKEKCIVLLGEQEKITVPGD